LKHFIQISHLCGKNSEADHLFENEEESRFNFLQIKGKLLFKQTRLHTSLQIWVFSLNWGNWAISIPSTTMGRPSVIAFH
jgi:hypothetical protein